MRRSVSILLALLLASPAVTNPALAQGAAPERKVITRVAPAYPELAKKMRIQGVVKVEAVVRPNGTVKSTRVVGGNPVLVDAAADAVSKWKFEPGSGETTELIQLTFVPQ
jgi:TonB family protein